MLVFASLTLLLILQVSASFAETISVDITSATDLTTVAINCSGSADINYVWKYTATGSNPALVQNSSSDVLSISNSAKTGMYVCSQGGNTLANYSAQNLFKPEIKHHGNSITYTEGDQNKTLTCESHSLPVPTFTWSRVEGAVDELLATHGNYLIKSDGAGKSDLLILNLKMNSRGTYKCSVSSDVGTKMTTLLVRVHSKLAFLWPLIGIAVEAIVILCIILVVRRHSAETTKAEAVAPSAAAAAAHSSTGNDEQANSDVRKRSSVRT